MPVWMNNARAVIKKAVTLKPTGWWLVCVLLQWKFLTTKMSTGAFFLDLDWFKQSLVAIKDCKLAVCREICWIHQYKAANEVKLKYGHKTDVKLHGSWVGSFAEKESATNGRAGAHYFHYHYGRLVVLSNKRLRNTNGRSARGSSVTPMWNLVVRLFSLVSF